MMKFLVLEGEEFVERESTIADFLSELPNFISKKNKLIPPKNVIQELLNSGNANLGMSGMYKWEPTLYSEKTLDQAIHKLLSDGFVKVDVPNWVNTRDEWIIWKLEYLHGVPADIHRQKLKIVNVKVTSYNNATSNNEELCRLEKIRAENDLADFINRTMNKRN